VQPRKQPKPRLLPKLEEKRKLLPKVMLKLRAKKVAKPRRMLNQSVLQRKLLFYSHWTTNKEPTQIPQTLEPHSMLNK